MSDPEPVREEPTKEISQEITEKMTDSAEIMPAAGSSAGSEPEKPGEPGENAAQDAREAQKRKTLFIAIGAVVVILAAAIGAYCLLSMPVAVNGDTVAIYYNESFENGTLFASNMNTTYPLVFILGNSSVIPGVQDAVIGMSPGEIKTVNIPYTQAYGAYDPGLVQTLNRTGPIANTSFEVGESFTIHYKATDSYSTVKIINVTAKTVTWDANSPLAGENLTFMIRLANLTKANTTAAAA